MLPNKAFPHRGEGGPQGRMRGQMGDRRTDEDIRPYVVLASFYPSSRRIRQDSLIPLLVLSPT